jgi:nuclease-like protein
VKVTRWEVGASLLGLAFAAPFVFSNLWGLGVALVCADALWLLTRIEVVARAGVAGRYASLRGRLAAVRLVFIGVVYAAVIYGILVVRHDLSPRARVAFVADFAMAGLGFMLLGELKRGGDDTLNWIFGARAERKVGAALAFFAHRGYLVLHGYPKDWGGDIDHIVCGRTGAYIIETKSYGFRSRDLRQAALNAWWLRERLRATWVTGVLCVAEDREAELKGKVWVVGHAQLVPWLEDQRNQPVDPESARRVLLESFEDVTGGASASG